MWLICLIIVGIFLSKVLGFVKFSVIIWWLLLSFVFRVLSFFLLWVDNISIVFFVVNCL